MTEKVDESILIETSNKISIAERRVHEYVFIIVLRVVMVFFFSRDVEMLTEEVKKQQELVRSVRKEKDEEARSRRLHVSAFYRFYSKKW